MNLLPALHDDDPGPQTCPRCQGESIWQGWVQPQRDPNLHAYRCAEGHEVVLRFVFDGGVFAKNRIRRKMARK